ncbi:helix-turn-helix domain-containing protein [Flavivirga spongiicola]|uniref:Helix-turn-helix domain-containing protein n=1 Tax=Flavivirga spongiicola TaxID=421621 RepID=A0ABU7Y151_9FLAO|nr:helix-turn-helix domain-containing protein [Flavivirga sp. MEBiC05379]MDO5980986.1 helix-turn-helix domain-containing protein [Flavivirga sp. MEBiC05379]
MIKKNKSRADKILVFWLLLISINQLFHYFTFTTAIYEYPDWLGIDLAMPVLIGVFLYFYVMEITGNKLDFNWKILWHFIPTILLVLLAVPFYKLSGPEKIYVFENEGLGFEWYTMIQNSVIALSGLAYSIWSLVIINRHQKRIKDKFSNTDKKELQWLRLLSIGFAIIWVLSMFFGNIIIFSAVVIFVLCIAIFGINQLSIFNSNLVELEELPDEQIVTKTKKTSKDVIKTEKYLKSGLNSEMASEIYSDLNGLMKADAIYKNANLTLVELAKRLDIHPNYLSQVINETEGKNFYNYVNALRIKEFISLASLPENKKYTMISLAYDCGFSTKSTFNKHFKLHTGKTPTEFFSTSSI